MMQPELQYPASPGFKKRDTSRQAAQDMQSRAKTIQEKVMRYLEINRSATSDEIACAIGEERHNVRSRCSELAIPEYDKKTRALIRPALIEDSGQRRINQHSGKPAIVWRVI